MLLGKVKSLICSDYTFCSFYSPFCIHPQMNTMQVMALDYLVATYPLFLIFLTYAVVSLHDRYPVVVRLWRPAYRVFLCLRREWNIRGLLVQAFASFLVLSFVKILDVSFDLVRFIYLYGNVYVLAMCMWPTVVTIAFSQGEGLEDCWESW